MTTNHECTFTLEVEVVQGIYLIYCICGECIMDRRFTPRSVTLTS